MRSLKRGRKQLFENAAICLILILFMVAVFAVHRTQLALNPLGWSRFLRLWIVDFPPTLVLILFAAWMAGNLRGGGLAGGLKFIGLSSLWKGATVVGLLAGVSAIIVDLLVVWLARAHIEPATELHGRIPYMLVVTAFGEEVLFRGFVFRIMRRRWSFISAAILASLIFTISHSIVLGRFLMAKDYEYAFFQFFMPFITGIYFAYLFERGGWSIWGCVIAHAGINANTFYRPLLIDGIPRNWWVFHGWEVTSFLIPAVQIGVILFGLWLLNRKRRSHGK